VYSSGRDYFSFQSRKRFFSIRIERKPGLLRKHYFLFDVTVQNG